MQLCAGAVLANKLRLLHPLGQGGMGVVWSAQHLTLDTEVAVKFIRPERVADPSLIARFEREARATARIAHPNVVKIMDYGTMDGSVPYIVMELLRGFSLAELLEKGGRLSFATARELLRQVGSALGSAHELGIVHRDIKPQNLFITQGSPLFVKVLDFGVAKMLGGAELHTSDATLTEAGVVIGSASYMSPEQLEASRHVDLRSDLWSLAVIVYETLTGALPFRGASFVAIGAAALKGEYAPVSQRRPDLPAGTDAWFSQALSRDPGARFASAGQMLQAFPTAESAEAARLVQMPSSAVAATRTTAHTDGAVAAAIVTEPGEGGPLATAGGAARMPRTVDHPPVARDPRRAALFGRVRRRHWLAMSATAALASVAGVAAWQRAHSASLTDCPSGMALIRGATFRLGSRADADIPSDETTPGGSGADATLPSFCLDVTEVTVQAYRGCRQCPKAVMTVEFEGLTPKGRDVESRFCNGADRPNHPMNCVDWFAAQAFCVAQGKRLPTEAEWELAARGPRGRKYPWGDAEPSGKYLNACDAECGKMLTERLYNAGRGPWPTMFEEKDWAASTAPVGQYPAGATPEGVLDLAGNVWEWTDSSYCRYPYDPETGCGDSRRVLRGGGWDTTEAHNVRAARRYPSVPGARGKSVGFRCARSL